MFMRASSSPKPTRSLRMIVLALLALSLACSAPFVQRTATPPPAAETEAVQPSPTVPAPVPATPLPPALVETQPAPGDEIGLDAPITFYFNQPMDRASVEQAFFSQPDLSATLTWENDAVLTVIPSRALVPATRLTLRLSTDARSAQGLALTQAVDLEYQTAGFLRLAQALPEPGAADVTPDSAIVAAFNRPVVPLGADPTGLPPAFRLEPAAEGRGEWLNTSTYIFYPQPPLAGGQNYTVTIDPDLRSAAGTELEQEYSWSFTTAEPRLVSVEPQPGASRVALDAPIVLTFNQPMDPASIEAGFSLLGSGAGSLDGQYTWNDDFTQVNFQPQVLLQRSTRYSISLPAQVQAAGGAALGEPLNASFTTVPQLAVVSTEPVQGGTRDPMMNVVLNFSAAIPPETPINNYLTISPTVSNLGHYWDSEALALYIYATWQPNTNYSLSLSPALPDPWGGTLGQPFTLNFTTGPLRPTLTLTSFSDILFLTPQDTSLTAQAANVNQATLTISSVYWEDFQRMLAPGGYEMRQGYQSGDALTWVQPLSVASDRIQEVQLNLRPDGQPLEPGIYTLLLDAPSAESGQSNSLLVVSSIQTTLKTSATDSLVWAVDVNSGAPITGAPVAVYYEDGSLLAQGQTDDQGLFYAEHQTPAEVYGQYYAVIGEPGSPGFGLAFSNWNLGLSGWNFGINTNQGEPQTKLYLYSDRPIYRPGQTVYFRGVLRQEYNARYSPPEAANQTLTLTDPIGEEVTRFDLPLTAFGTFHGEYAIPQDAQPGYYYLNPGEGIYGGLEVQVAEYRKPEIDLQVSFSADDYLSDETLTAQVSARYFFGAPAGDVPVTWILYAQQDSFYLPGYTSGPADDSWLAAYRMPFPGDELGTQVANGEGRTTPEGLLPLELESILPEGLPEGTRLRYTLEVTAQDESGLPVSARDTTLVHPAEFYIGLQPNAWVGRAGEQTGIQVQLVDWAGSPAGSHGLRAEFQSIEWVQEMLDPGRDVFAPSLTPRYTTIASTDFVTNDQGQARLAFTPPQPGSYQVVVSGEGARSELLWWVAGQGQAIWPDLPNGRLELNADQDSYLPGQTAQVFVPNPFPRPAQALISIERSKIMRYELITLQPGGSTLPVPLSDEDAPNVYFSVTLLDPAARDYRLGYQELQVKPVQQTLDVSLAAQPEKSGPGEAVNLDLLVTDASGQPVEGEFSLAVVDLAVLALADPNAPDIVPAFYSPKPLGVNTALALVAWAGRFSSGPGGLGGGGGDFSIPTVRQEFPDTAYWNPTLVTGPDGRGSVSLTLPDSLTTWQVDVRGLTQDTRVGQAQAQIVTSKDLLVRPVTPRFFVAGDHVQLAAVLQNNTGEPLEAQIQLQTSGFTLDDASVTTQSVTLPANGRIRVEWWGVAQDVPEVDLVFAANANSSSGALEDAARPALGALPVLHYSAPQTFRTAGVLDEDLERLELVSLPRSFDPSSGSLQVELSPSLAAAMLNALEALEHFPYECTEQTLSRFLPNLETYRALQRFEVQSPDLESRLNRTLPEGLQRLLARQNPDGGWSWWQQGESDAYITAYVLFGLRQAQDAGVQVDDQALANAIEYLKRELPSPDEVDQTWQLDRLAFAYFALGLDAWEIAPADSAGSANQTGGPEMLYERRDELNPWAQALLALTLFAGDPQSQSAQTLLSDLQSSATRSATGAHWELNAGDTPEGAYRNMMTTLTNTSLVVYALAQYDAETPLLADAVRYLMANRGADGAWASTYASAWSIMALTEFMQNSGDLGGQFDFTASLNGAPLASGQAGDGGQINPVVASAPITSLAPESPNALLIERSTGNGRLYYTAGLQVSRPVEEVAAYSAGLNLARSYYPDSQDCPTGDCLPIDRATGGALINVRLSLTLPNDAYYLLVEDYIPAGAEILDINLKTSQQGAAVQEAGPVPPPEMEVQAEPEPLFDPRQPFSQGWGWWLFSPPRIYDDHIAWSADYLPAGSYQLTYTLVLSQPGEYRVLPARAWQFYFPEVQANSAGGVFSINAAP